MSATKLTDQDLIEELTELVGPTLVALTAGSNHRRAVERWLSGEMRLQEPERRRLQVAHDLLNEVGEASGSNDLARAWFIGANVEVQRYLGLTSPAEAISHNLFDEASASAKVMGDPEDMGK